MLARVVDLIVLAALSIAIYPVLHPTIENFANKLLSPVQRYESIVVLSVTLGLAIVVSAVAACWYRRIGGVYLRSFFKKPPVWAIGVFCFLILELLATPLLEKSGEKIGSWTDVCLVLVVVLSGALVTGRIDSLSESERRVDLDERKPENTVNIIDDAVEIISWIQKETAISNPKEDKFGMKPFGRRIANILGDTPLKTVSVVGPYGCGKSSILNMAEYYLQSRKCEVGSSQYLTENIIVCRVSGWGFHEGTAAEHILRVIVNAIAKDVDCVGLKGIPRAYRQVLSNSGNVIERTLGVLSGGWQNPLDLLRRLDDIAIHIGKRVVVFLEDVDRNVQNEVFFNEIAVLLEGLKELEQISFVVAIGDRYREEEVVTKVSEHIEVVPELGREETFKLLRTFRNHCLTMFPEDIDFLSKKDREEHTGFDRSEMGDLLHEFEVSPQDPIDSMVSLLRNPRVLKHAFRKTYQAWEKLHGEIDFDELLACKILETTSIEVYLIINSIIPAFRSLGHRGTTSEGQKRDDSNRKMLKERIDEQTKGKSWDVSAANSLINFIFPGWIENMFSHSMKRPQSMGADGVTDYWKRANLEEIGEKEIRDQEVMRAIKGWKVNNESKVYRDLILPEAIFEVEGFADKVEQFGMSLDGKEVRCLATELFKLILEEGKKIVKADRYFGFAQLWRLSLDKRLDKNEHERWVLEELRKALSVSFRFANDVYYYWRHQERSMASDSVPTIELREKFVEAGRDTYSGNVDLLIKVIDPDFMWSVHHFVRLFSKGPGGPGYKPEEWRWFGDVLVEAAIKAPKVMVPQIACLVVDSGEQFKGGTWGYPCQFNKDAAQKIFGHKGLAKILPLLAEGSVNPEFGDQGKAMMGCAISFAKGEIHRNMTQNENDQRR